MSESIRHRPTGPLPEPPDRDLHERLLAASRSIAFPDTPDIATSIRAALDREGMSPRSQAAPTRPTLPWTPRPAALAAVVALLLLAGVLLFPATRETVAGWLGVPGIQIQFTDDEPTPTVAATPQPNLGLLLGEPVTLEEARRRVGFAIALPETPELGMPDEIYVRMRGGLDQVVFLYSARPGFPAAAETGIGLLLIQFEAPEDAFWGVKGVTAGNEVRVVRVNGDEGLWIGGSHQLIIAPDPDPIPRAQPTAVPGDLIARTSGNVLLWSENGVTYRIESALSRQASIALAESVSPLDRATPIP